jgi:hypothetical protein
VCDGGSDSLRMLVSQGDGRQGAISVIDKFFPDHSSIDFLVVIEIDRRDKFPFSYGMGKPVLRLQSFEDPRHKRPETQLMNELLCQLTELIPPPCSDVINAILHLQSQGRRVGISSKRGLEMTSEEVRLSVRGIGNPFERALDRGD